MITLRHALLLPMALALAPLAPAAGAAEAVSPALPGWSRVAIVPWGKGPGHVEEAIRSTDERQVYRGPTRLLALPDGGFAVLDTLGNAVEEFDRNGAFVRELPFPATDEHDADTLAIDMALRQKGEYWLLSAGRRAAMRLTGPGQVEWVALDGMAKDAIPMAIAVDGGGTLHVLDGNDNSVYRRGPDGKSLPSARDDTAQFLAVDSKGVYYGLALAGTSDAKTLRLQRWLPPAAPVQFGLYESELETSRMDVFGIDAGGNVHAFLCSGAIEKPSRREIVRFGPGGQVTGRADCPDDPAEPHFVHGKTVAPDGTLFSVAVAAKGLVVLRHAPLESK